MEKDQIFSKYLSWGPNTDDCHPIFVTLFIRENVCCGKLLQSCPTLCDPMDSSLPGSSVHEILLARILVPFLLQGIFPTQGLNPGFLHCRLFLYHPNQGSPRRAEVFFLSFFFFFDLQVSWLLCLVLWNYRFLSPQVDNTIFENSNYW